MIGRPLLLTVCASLSLAGGCVGDDAPPNQTDGTGDGTFGGCASQQNCGDSSSTTRTDPDTTAAPDSTAAATDEGDTTAAGIPDECAVSPDCSPDFCVAPFNPVLGVFGRGPFACVAECVPLDDDFQWCADAEACCDADATCTDRGYCKLEGADSTDSTDGGSDTGADDGGSTTR